MTPAALLRESDHHLARAEVEDRAALHGTPTERAAHRHRAHHHRALAAALRCASQEAS